MDFVLVARRDFIRLQHGDKALTVSQTPQRPQRPPLLLQGGDMNVVYCRMKADLRKDLMNDPFLLHGSQSVLQDPPGC